MNAHYVLVSAKPVDLMTPSDEARAMSTFLSGADTIKLKGELSRRLGDSTWLLHRESDVLALAQLVFLADKHRIVYEVRYLRDDN